MPVLLRLQRVRRTAQAPRGRLLRVLLLWIGAVPADTDQHALLRAGRSLNPDTTGKAMADAAGVTAKPSRAGFLAGAVLLLTAGSGWMLGNDKRQRRRRKCLGGYQGDD
jgi:hypothetical protein